MFLSKLKDIQRFILDVDGVLTDGTVHITEEGAMLRNMNIKDGFVLQYAVKQGYEVIIISGGHSEGVVKRLNGLGIQMVFTAIKDKKTKLHSLMQEHGWDKKNCLYIGDDMPDLPPMELCELSCCPCDAAIDVQTYVDYISDKQGGKGCVRDVVEKTLRVQDKWISEDLHHW